MEIPCECGIEPPDFISHGVSDILVFISMQNIASFFSADALRYDIYYCQRAMVPIALAMDDSQTPTCLEPQSMLSELSKIGND